MSSSSVTTQTKDRYIQLAHDLAARRQREIDLATATAWRWDTLGAPAPAMESQDQKTQKAIIDCAHRLLIEWAGHESNIDYPMPPIDEWRAWHSENHEDLCDDDEYFDRLSWAEIWISANARDAMLRAIAQHRIYAADVPRELNGLENELEQANDADSIARALEKFLATRADADADADENENENAK